MEKNAESVFFNSHMQQSLYSEWAGVFSAGSLPDGVGAPY